MTGLASIPCKQNRYKLKHFGENYVQEALVKITTLNNINIIWHFIGSIQSNKTRQIAMNFSWVHSIDRFKVMERLNNFRPKSSPKLNICLQVNIDNETTKSGISPADLPDIINEIKYFERLELRGLMCIPKLNNSENAFIKMRILFQQYPQLDTLSMGMSQDFDLAIKYGSTIVRLGKAIFGNRY